MTALSSVGVIVNCYDLNRTGFTSPMLFLIPGIPEDSIFFYPTNIIFQVILYFSTMEMIIVSDAVIMIIIMYFQAELLVITEFLLKLEKEDKVAARAKTILKTVHEEHKRVMEMFNDISFSFWHTYFHKLLAIVLYLCFTFFALKSVISSLVVALLCAVSMVEEAFILCYFGQIVRDASDTMAEALYMSKWYEMQVSDQKDLLMLMMRFKYPFKVETFAFGTISIYTFVQVMNLSSRFIVSHSLKFDLFYRFAKQQCHM